MLSLYALTVSAFALGEMNAPPPYFTAQERWECEFASFIDSEKVVSYFGVFRSHVEDDLGLNFSIAQNDDEALVFVMSGIGDIDIQGTRVDSVLLTVIDKRTREFRRSVFSMSASAKDVKGVCRPY